MKLMRFILLAGGLVAVAMLLVVSSHAQTTEDRWSSPINLAQTAVTDNVGSTIIVCDQYQNLHIFWSQLSPMHSALYYRTDIDGTLSSAIDVVALGDPVAIRLKSLVTEGDNSIHLFWASAYIGGTILHASAPLATAGDARAWSSPIAIANDTGDIALAVDPKGQIHAVYGARGDDGRQLFIMHILSGDGGSTWTAPIPIYSTYRAIASTIGATIAIDDHARAHLGITIRSEEYGLESEVGYLRSLDDGNSWEPYVLVQYGGSTFQGVSTITPYAFGDSLHLTWHDPRRMHQWSADGGSTWSDPQEITSLGAAFGGANELVQDSAGQIHAILADSGSVLSATWDGGAWTGVQQIDNRYIDPHGQHLVACQGNRLYATYYDRTGPRGAWYSTRLLNAPSIARVPVPIPDTPPNPSHEDDQLARLPLTRTVPSSPPLLPDFADSPPKTSRELLPIIAAALPALLFALAAVWYTSRRSW